MRRISFHITPNTAKISDYPLFLETRGNMIVLFDDAVISHLTESLDRILRQRSCCSTFDIALHERIGFFSSNLLINLYDYGIEIIY